MNKQQILESRKYPVYLKKSMDQYMVGQNSYKEKVAMAIFKHNKYGLRNPIMVIGPSGSGKTYLMELLEKIDILPDNYNIMIFDGSRQTPSGISGDDATTMIEKWKTLCRKSGNKEYRGIIFIDEIDKIIMPNTTSSGENINAITQYQLMNIISGTKIEDVDTNNILFILGGAFVQLDEYEQKSKTKNPIGFVPNQEKEKSDYDLRDKLINIGAQREFMGRITSIIRLDKLSRSELKALLINPQNGVIARKQKEFEQEGLILEIRSEVYDILIRKVIQENLGARSLSNILDRVVGDSDYYAIANDYNRICVTKESIDGNGKLEFYKEGKMTVTTG